MTEWLTIPCPDCQGEGVVFYGKFAPRNDDICEACDGDRYIEVHPDDIEEPK